MLDSRPQVTSQDAIETESLHISPIQGNISNLNVFENSMTNITRVQTDSVYDQTTLQDGEQTVIGGTQESYQEEPVYTNDDPEVFLTYFTTRSNLVTEACLLEKVKTVDFSETLAACDLKVGRCRQLFEVMKVCKY